MKIIGFEGGAEDTVPVTYGAAALTDGVILLNPVTKSRVPIEEWDSLVVAGHVTPVYEAELRMKDEGLPYYVLRVWIGSRLWMTMQADDRTGWVQSWQDLKGGWQFWLFPSFRVLDILARRLAASLRFAAKYVSCPDEAQEMLTDAKVLDPYDGKTKEEYLDALKAR